MLICEAAGFDVVIVETVGVGQSEVDVSNMVDTFVLLLHPGAGDELQGVKRGVLEISDIVVVHKSDGSFMNLAKKTKAAYESSLSLFRPRSEQWPVTPVLMASSLENEGLGNVWNTILSHHDVMERHGLLAQKRAVQAQTWMWSIVNDELGRRFKNHEAIKHELEQVSSSVQRQQVSPTHGALSLIEKFFGATS